MHIQYNGMGWFLTKFAALWDHSYHRGNGGVLLKCVLLITLCSIIDFLCLSLKDHYNQEWAAACAATVNTMQQMQVFFNSAAVLKLGVDGSLLFIQLLHYVPAELSSYRFKYVADIQFGIGDNYYH